MTDEYRSCLDFLYGRLNYERSTMPRGGAELRLGRMRRLLRRLQDPQDAFRIVHVTGTKGKGSTCALLAGAIAASGTRTGLFCSPHLHRLEERFQIDGCEISPAELVELTESVRSVVIDCDATETASGARELTFFEVATAMGLLHFARRNAGVVVLEVGMGGRLDSTNVVRPALSIINSVSFDHTRQLGRTLGTIAYEKAGIIKHRTPCLTGVTDPEPLDVIRRVAGQRNSRLYELGPDFGFEYTPPVAPISLPRAGSVAVRSGRSQWGPLELPLFGRHQAHNAALALTALDLLADQGLEVSPAMVAQGFANLRFPARVEVLGTSPWLIVDGAHNVASAQALADTLRTCFPEVPRTLVFGTTRDKNLYGQLDALLPLFDRCVATRYVENPRSVPPRDVSSAVLDLTGQATTIASTPEEALDAARNLTPSDGLICVTGSLFLAAEVRAKVLGFDRAMTWEPIAAP